MENFLDKILKVKPIVLEILKTNLESRDDDNVPKLTEGGISVMYVQPLLVRLC